MLRSLTKSGTVAIIGRPNVGKSTLFNLLTRSRQAVVKNQPGVTRDILIENVHWWGQDFQVMDTGGITDTQDEFSPLIKQQVLSVLGSVHLIVVVMDGKSGLVPEDRDLFRLAQESGKPFVIVVNKIDRFYESDLLTSEFYEFGHQIISCSFEKRQNTDEVVEWIKGHLPEQANEEREGVRLAIVGKPNVGKSSLCNFLLKEKRMLVSDIAGTTVDAVETVFRKGEKNYILVDTAGLRRSAKRDDDVEILASFKTQSAIKRSNVVLLLVDGLSGPTDQDARIVQTVLEQNKVVILCANKIDLALEERKAYRSWFRSEVEKNFHFFKDIPIAFISAKTGKGIDKLFEQIDDLWSKLHIKIPTSKLNKFFYESIRSAPSPVYGTKDVKFFYVTQTSQVPPSFIAYANHPDGVTPSYRRFLSKRIKKEYNLEGIPVRMFVMRGRS